MTAPGQPPQPYAAGPSAPTGVVEMRYWLKAPALLGTPRTVLNGWQVPRCTDLVQRYEVPAGPVTVSCSAPPLCPQPQISFLLPPGQVVPVFYADSLLKHGGGSLSLTDPGPERRSAFKALMLGIFLALFMTMLTVGGIILLLSRLG